VTGMSFGWRSTAGKFFGGLTNVRRLATA